MSGRADRGDASFRRERGCAHARGMGGVGHISVEATPDSIERPSLLTRSVEMHRGESVEDAMPEPKSATSRARMFSLVGVVVLLAALASACVWYFQVKAPHDEAVSAFNEAGKRYSAAVEGLTARNGELADAISDLQNVIDSDARPLDPDLLTSAGATIGEAQGSRDRAPKTPDIPKSTEDIEKATTEFPAHIAEVEDLGDYGTQIIRLSESKSALEASIKQMQQVTNPDEVFVINRIKNLPAVRGVQAVTEDNDPNGNLNKQGGYTATVYLASTLVNQTSVFGRDIVDKGTEAGGAVEVYRTVDDARKRDTYLGAFDGGILSSGSHRIVGTLVIRTSDKLTAMQQTKLEAAIRKALTRLG